MGPQGFQQVQEGMTELGAERALPSTAPHPETRSAQLDFGPLTEACPAF